MRLPHAQPCRLALLTATLLAALALASPAQAAGVPGQGTWETTLQPRDLDLDGAVDGWYDTALHITWLSIVPTHGSSWADASQWIASLNNAHLKGYSDWRLPGAVDTGAAGCQASMSGTDCGYNVQTSSSGGSSELAHLFYVSLGNQALYDTSGNLRASGYGLVNTGPWGYLPSGGYWYGTTYSNAAGVVPGVKWAFDAGVGSQGSIGEASLYYALAVRSGDVAAVPEPGAASLLLAGLLGLAGWSRGRRQTR